MSLEKEFITIDYTDERVPASVQNFRPAVYRDADTYYMILGSDAHAVVGCGSTIEAAMKAWDEAYWKKRYH
jgi:hypothetical protein